MKNVNEQSQRLKPQWVELLNKAVNEPGKVSEAYRLFHSYSLGNALAASYQCDKREIALGPINTFQGWKALGRNVRKGQKAILLCQPITAKVKGDNDETAEFIRAFVWKPKWFVFSQTDGADYQPETVTGTWDKTKALAALNIREVPFDHPNGNVQGFAKGRSIAVSPIAALPHKTLFHELAHVVLGHTLRCDCSDTTDLPRALREVEAESVALLLTETLQLGGSEFSRGYIQWWLSGAEIPEQSAQRIFSAAHTIISAGK